MNGTPNIFVEPMYIAWSGSFMSTLAGGSGGLERNALLAISLVISSWSFISVISSCLITHTFHSTYKYTASHFIHCTQHTANSQLCLSKYAAHLVIGQRYREVELEERVQLPSHHSLEIHVQRAQRYLERAYLPLQFVERRLLADTLSL